MTKEFNSWFLINHEAAYEAEVSRRTTRNPNAHLPRAPKRMKIVLDDDRRNWPPAMSDFAFRSVFHGEDSLAHIKFMRGCSDVCDDCSAFYTQKVVARQRWAY